MKIINNTKLNYQAIGKFIDDYINSKYDDTCYVGKIEYFVIDYKDVLYKIQIRYLKRYVEWRFNYYENNN